MNRLITIFLLSSTICSFGQNSIDWDGKYQIQLSDFQARTTQIENTNTYSLYTAASFDFSFSMTKAAFMFSKNFNSKSKLYFQT